MTVQNQENETLVPGNILSFDTSTDLVNFEDIVARQIAPRMTPLQQGLWAARLPLTEHIRPDKFYGRLATITLEVMANPYDRLVDARERGLKMGLGSFNKRLIPEQDLTYGFIFRAEAYSSGKGCVAEVNTEMWYMPSRRNGRTRTNYHEGGVVMRVIAKPTLNKDRIDEANHSSRMIAIQLTRDRLGRMTLNPM